MSLILGVFEMVLGAAMLYAGVAVAARAHRAGALYKGPKEVAYLLRAVVPLGVYFGLQGIIHLLKGGLSLIGG